MAYAVSLAPLFLPYPSFPHSPVIPAKAGIHTLAYRGNPHPFILRPAQDERMLTVIPTPTPVIPA